MKFLSLALALVSLCRAAGPDSEKAKIMGSLTAPVRLDLYSDFSCPMCKMFHDQILPKIAAEYINTGRAYLVFHEYVLNIPGHEHSREAATYAVAASRMGRYAQVTGALFQSQETWTKNGQVWPVVSAVLTPVERTKIQTLIKDPAVIAEVQHDIDAGNQSRVDRTPTVVVSRRGKQTPWSFWGNYELFRSFLNDVAK
jgi:protein-disulfide isomerase